MDYYTQPRFFNRRDEVQEATMGSRTSKGTDDGGGCVCSTCIEEELHTPSVEALHGCRSALIVVRAET